MVKFRNTSDSFKIKIVRYSVQDYIINLFFVKKREGLFPNFVKMNFVKSMQKNLNVDDDKIRELSMKTSTYTNLDTVQKDERTIWRENFRKLERMNVVFFHSEFTPKLLNKHKMNTRYICIYDPSRTHSQTHTLKRHAHLRNARTRGQSLAFQEEEVEENTPSRKDGISKDEEILIRQKVCFYS